MFGRKDRTEDTMACRTCIGSIDHVSAWFQESNQEIVFSWDNAYVSV